MEDDEIVIAPSQRTSQSAEVRRMPVFEVGPVPHDCHLGWVDAQLVLQRLFEPLMNDHHGIGVPQNPAFDSGHRTPCHSGRTLGQFTESERVEILNPDHYRYAPLQTQPNKENCAREQRWRHEDRDVRSSDPRPRSCQPEGDLGQGPPKPSRSARKHVPTPLDDNALFRAPVETRRSLRPEGPLRVVGERSDDPRPQPLAHQAASKSRGVRRHAGGLRCVVQPDQEDRRSLRHD